ncbi:TetR/AcrR family transcriptional regulator [Acidocella sp.]|uniref:TetR/AcrR family transcriptional regulator n=1 Tax=Acidocella sp. TaxID=50710 RepID=UPI0026263546|nr:TetR/AcrR family transcriptional regulator [Acidocella sp.]
MKHKPNLTAGRPRAFDRDEALRIAMKLFSKHGYEGVSIADLTAAMNIAPPSLYAAFGSKEALFREALALYLQRPDLPHLACTGPVRDQIRKLLHDTVRAATDPDFPAGCMVTAGMLTCRAEHEGLADSIAGLRTARCEQIAGHVRDAVRAGELPPDTDTKAIGRFVMALAQGIAIQAHDGATAAELFALVDVALQSWPGAAPARPAP